jgi:hypothetical protein
MILSTGGAAVRRAMDCMVGMLMRFGAVAFARL